MALIDRAALLVGLQAAARKQQEQRLIRALLNLWRTEVRDPFNGDQAYRFASRGADLARVAEQATAAQSAAFVDTFTAEAFGTRQRATKLAQVASVRGTGLVEVLDRVPATARRARLLGLDELKAELEAERRMESIARDSVAVSSRRGADLAMKANGVTSWRRVIRPELSEGGTCGLCVAASTRTYSVAELMPIHDRCKCLVVPAERGGKAVDLADELNAQDLAQVRATDLTDLGNVYDASGGSTAGEALKQTRFQVNEHGELGAVITLQGRKSRSPAKAAEAARRRPSDAASVEKVLAGLRARAAAGENVSAALAYQERRLSVLREPVAG